MKKICAVIIFAYVSYCYGQNETLSQKLSRPSTNVFKCLTLQGVIFTPVDLNKMAKVVKYKTTSHVGGTIHVIKNGKYLIYGTKPYELDTSTKQQLISFCKVVKDIRGYTEEKYISFEVLDAMISPEKVEYTEETAKEREIRAKVERDFINSTQGRSSDSGSDTEELRHRIDNLEQRSLR